MVTKRVGGAKGTMFSVPGLGTAKLAAGTVGIATAENYLHSAAKGDVSAEALGKALANGTIEGVTAGLVDAAAKKVLCAHVHTEAEPVSYLDPYEMLEEHGISVTLSEEQRAACDTAGMQMKLESNSTSSQWNTGNSRLKPSIPEKVITVLDDYTSIQWNIGGNQISLDKKAMKHILKRHHPTYWDGSVKETQSFFKKMCQ